MNPVCPVLRLLWAANLHISELKVDVNLEAEFHIPGHFPPSILEQPELWGPDWHWPQVWKFGAITQFTEELFQVSFLDLIPCQPSAACASYLLKD